MADKPNQSYIEQLREMRALRTQQLRQQGADKAFYSSMNSSQKMLLRSNEKMIASMENMSRSILSGFKGLAVSIGGIAGKGVSVAAGGVSDIAGSIAGGLTKVLPIAIAGVLAKVLFWDNLTGESKDKLTKSAANLFESIFGNVPEYLGKMVNGIKGQLESLNISSPLLSALSKKAGQFVEVLTAGFDVIKPFFDQIIDFVSKDPAELIKNSLKAIGIGALSALLLPTAGAILLALLKSSLISSAIDRAFERRMPLGGGGGGPGPIIPPGSPGSGGGNQPRGPTAGPQGQPKKPYGAGAARATAAAIAKQAGTGWALARAIGGRAIGALFGPVGLLLSIGLIGYQIYAALKKEGIPDNDIRDALEAHGVDAEFIGVRVPSIPSDQEFSTFTKLSGKGGEKEALNNANRAVNSTVDQDLSNAYQQDVEDVKKVIAYRKGLTDLTAQTDLEDSLDAPAFIKEEFYMRWNALSDADKRFAIQVFWPLFKTAKYVYFAGENGKIMKLSYSEYDKLVNKGDPTIVKATADQLSNAIAASVKNKESRPIGGEASSYDVVFGNGKYGSTGKPLTQMTGAEVQEYQKQLVAATKKDNVAGGRGTGAVGAYQATQTTLADFYNDPANAGLKNKLFNEEVQDAFFKWRINKDMTDYMSGNITKDQFVNKISGIWEAFGSNPEYKKELAALIDDPSKYTSTSAKLTEKQKEFKAKVDIERFKQALKELNEPLGDTTPLIVKGTDVAKVMKDSTEAAVETGKKGVSILSKILSKPGNIDFEELITNFESLTDELDSKFQEIYKAQNGKQVSSVSDNSSTVLSINNSGGGGGGGINIAQVKSNHDYNTPFNSLAGGRLPA